ncbi:hypothetical protein V2J09_007024 [Rumex salicifolius]
MKVKPPPPPPPPKTHRSFNSNASFNLKVHLSNLQGKARRNKIPGIEELGKLRLFKCYFSGLFFCFHRKPIDPSERSCETSKVSPISCQGANMDFQSQTFDGKMMNSKNIVSANIIQNHDFSQGLHSWHPNCCQCFIAPSQPCNLQGLPKSDGGYAVATDRKECWQGLEQDITTKVSSGLTYNVSACVGVSGPPSGSSDVIATLRLENHDSTTTFQFISRIAVPNDQWETLEGSFMLPYVPKRVVFYLEGPSPGVDLLIKSVVIHSPSQSLFQSPNERCITDTDDNVIINPEFDDGLNNWSGRGCNITINNSLADGKILPKSGKVFASTSGRTQSWNGIQQEITGRVQRKLAYQVTAVVRIYGNNVTSASLSATLWVQIPGKRDQYVGVSSVQATDSDWAVLQGKFLLNGSPSKVVIYLEGPPAGTEILLNSLVVKHAQKTPPSPPPIIENAAYGVNIIQNSELSNGTNVWFSLGNCTLSVATGSPRILPPMAKESLGAHKPLNGRYILVTNRTQTWMGPAQIITDQLKLFLTYQVSAWVKVGSTASGPQNVNVALSVDNQWVNGGQVDATSDRWHEIGGSFRIEKQPSKVMVYIQGPSSGVDLMIAGLQIFAVNREARYKHLKREADNIRKRDVVLKFNGPSGGSSVGSIVKVKQTTNSFPIGSCISRSNIDNEDFVDFFMKNFNWAVFANELKWYWTEAQQGNLNYSDADEMLDLCLKNNIQPRGHCIFWEVESTVQSWIRALSNNDLATAVQNRLKDLLTRYKGKFKHYDVNNEMLHGSFYQDRLGKDIRANMFKTANQLDPDALLFVNDYHIEDGNDTRSTPEKYIEQILDLQAKGAPVGGIGVQGHIDNPVGPIVASALDKLGILGLPVWFTELDVSSVNEHVRADDLEVMLREAFAHPSVEGVMLWGFWELFMSRDNSHLVNAEGDVNEAGQRLIELKKEWTSHAHGYVDEQGEFGFRGFHGSYQVEVFTHGKAAVIKTFVVDKDDSPLVVDIDL